MMIKKEAGFCSRRTFLTTVGLAAGGGPLLGRTDAEEPKLNGGQKSASEPNRVKFSVFADLHHFPGVFYSQTPEHLTAIQERAVRENCDFIIHVGDFTHNPPACQDFIAQYNHFALPSYHTLGNHDQDGCPWEETLRAYQMEQGHYYFDRNGFRFIVLDPNYILLDGQYIHYTASNYYKTAGRHPIVPPEQLHWLSERLRDAPGPCVLFSHQSFEREIGGVLNWREIRDLIHGVNREIPGRVRLCVNGHHHRDFLRVLDDVVYFDLNSATHDWVERTHDLYPKELCEQYKLINHTVVFNDPIHAVITLDAAGLIKIEGMESSMLMDITREKAGMNFADQSGRPVFPRVQSATFRVEA